MLPAEGSSQERESQLMLWQVSHRLRTQHWVIGVYAQ
jgi:hypothetical protein